MSNISSIHRKFSIHTKILKPNISFRKKLLSFSGETTHPKSQLTKNVPHTATQFTRV
jgi:hypothetical protein